MDFIFLLFVTGIYVKYPSEISIIELHIINKK